MIAFLVVLLTEAKALIVAKAALLVVAVVGSGAVVAVVVSTHKPEFPMDPLTVIEQPKLGQALNATIDVTGFSIDRNAKTGTGVSKVALYLDAVDEQHKLGEATLGHESEEALTYRKDKDDERFDKAGWTFTWAQPQLEGDHVLFVLAWSSLEPIRFSVTKLEINDPLVRITAPEPGDEVSGDLIVRGWALDRYVPEGTATAHQIDRVEIYVDDTLQGTAQLGLASPGDVRERYGVAQAGWSFALDTSALEPGEHRLRAVAYSSVQDSENEASILIVVFDPVTRSGDGCGWLVGRAKGDAIHALQAGWKHFHESTQSYQSKMGSVDQSRRASLRSTVHETRAALQDRRHEAMRELNAKAHEYLSLCHAGRDPDMLAVTVDQDVVGAEHLLFGYRPIVDAAIADMERIYGTAKLALDAFSTSDGQGAADGRGRGGRGRP